MKWFKIFIVMVQFFTRIPIKYQFQVEKEDFGRGLIFAPLVGTLIGGILWAFHFVFSQIFPQQLTSVFLLISYILLTGGLHLDGLGDTFDGLFSNRPKERILEIMRDSRVGTNAVLALLSLFFINYATLSSFPHEMLGTVIFLLPIAGRIGSLVGAGMHPYARSGEGLGKTFVDYCGGKEILIGFGVAGIIFFATLGWAGLVFAAVSLSGAWVTSTFFARKIGGITGDILGAVCEMNQTIFILVYFIILSSPFKILL